MNHLSSWFPPDIPENLLTSSFEKLFRDSKSCDFLWGLSRNFVVVSPEAFIFITRKRATDVLETCCERPRKRSAETCVNTWRGLTRLLETCWEDPKILCGEPPETPYWNVLGEFKKKNCENLLERGKKSTFLEPSLWALLGPLRL